MSLVWCFCSNSSLRRRRAPARCASCPLRRSSRRAAKRAWRAPCARRCAAASRSWAAPRSGRNRFARAAPPFRARHARARLAPAERRMAPELSRRAPRQVAPGRCEIAARMSFLLMRPPAPVPRQRCRDRSCFRAPGGAPAANCESACHRPTLSSSSSGRSASARSCLRGHAVPAPGAVRLFVNLRWRLRFRRRGRLARSFGVAAAAGLAAAT